MVRQSHPDKHPEAMNQEKAYFEKRTAEIVTAFRIIE